MTTSNTMCLILAWSFTLFACRTSDGQERAPTVLEPSSVPQDEGPRPSMTLEKIIRASELLPNSRRELLDASASRIRKLRSDGSIHLLGVCTHNSRRSQFCQAWCSLAVAHYKVPGVDCYSCGTEATACNERTIAALERSGWQIKRPASRESNPRYECSFSDTARVVLWSKAFGDPSLPTQRIVALLCCDEADKACPTVPGAIARTATIPSQTRRRAFAPSSLTGTCSREVGPGRHRPHGSTKP